MDLCGPARFDERSGAGLPSLLDPQVIFEVLSPSTEAFERSEKFRGCRRIETLTDYVLVASDRRCGPCTGHRRRQVRRLNFGAAPVPAARPRLGRVRAPASERTVQTRPLGEPWCSSRRATCRGPAVRLFCAPCAVGRHLDAGAVQRHDFDLEGEDLLLLAAREYPLDHARLLQRSSRL